LASFNSSAGSLGIVAVTAVPPPISILTWVVVTPFFHFDDLARELLRALASWTSPVLSICQTFMACAWGWQGFQLCRAGKGTQRRARVLLGS
jgi:hypothetical protein